MLISIKTDDENKVLDFATCGKLENGQEIKVPDNFDISILGHCHMKDGEFIPFEPEKPVPMPTAEKRLAGLESAVLDLLDLLI